MLRASLPAAMMRYRFSNWWGDSGGGPWVGVVRCVRGGEVVSQSWWSRETIGGLNGEQEEAWVGVCYARWLRGRLLH